MTERAYQQYTRVIPAGGAANLPAFGEFIYCAQADRPITVTVGSQSVDMQSGDKGRFNSPFRNVELRNPTETDVLVRFIIGWGDYERLIVQGTVTSAPAIIGLDGARADTRYELPLRLVPTPGSGFTVSRGDVAVADFADPEYGLALTGGIYFDREADEQALLTMSDSGDVVLARLDVPSGAIVELLRENVGNFIDGGSIYGGAWDRDYYYVFGYDGTKTQAARVWRRRRFGADSFQLFYIDEMGGSNTRVAKIVRDGTDWLVITTSNKDIARVDSTGTVRNSINLENDVDSGWGTANTMFIYRDELWVQDQNRFGIFDLDLAFSRYTSAVYDFNDQAHPWYYWLIQTPDRDSKLSLRELDNQTLGITGRAYDAACPGHELLSRPDQFEANRSGALVETALSGSTALVTGEVIRLALEWYAGRSVADDYLDHVHGVEILGAGGGGRGTPRRQVVQTEGRSFAAAQIPDAFAARLPATVRLTLDNGLEFK